MSYHAPYIGDSPYSLNALLDRTEQVSINRQEQAFDEFHLYTLGRPTTLPNNSTKQIELFDQARQVPA